VRVKSETKLYGFKWYQYREDHPRTGQGTFGEVYYYEIPDEKLEKALSLGGELIDAT